MRGSFKSKPIGLSYSHGAYGIQFGMQYADALEGLLSYVCKGADRQAVATLCPSRVEPGGEMWGKRYGMSENINRTTRLRALKKGKMDCPLSPHYGR